MKMPECGDIITLITEEPPTVIGGQSRLVGKVLLVASLGGGSEQFVVCSDPASILQPDGTQHTYVYLDKDRWRYATKHERREFLRAVTHNVTATMITNTPKVKFADACKTFLQATINPMSYHIESNETINEINRGPLRVVADGPMYTYEPGPLDPRNRMQLQDHDVVPGEGFAFVKDQRIRCYIDGINLILETYRTDVTDSKMIGYYKDQDKYPYVKCMFPLVPWFTEDAMQRFCQTSVMMIDSIDLQYLNDPEVDADDKIKHLLDVTKLDFNQNSWDVNVKDVTNNIIKTMTELKEELEFHLDRLAIFLANEEQPGSEA